MVKSSYVSKPSDAGVPSLNFTSSAKVMGYGYQQHRQQPMRVEEECAAAESLKVDVYRDDHDGEDSFSAGTDTSRSSTEEDTTRAPFMGNGSSMAYVGGMNSSFRNFTPYSAMISPHMPPPIVVTGGYGDDVPERERKDSCLSNHTDRDDDGSSSDVGLPMENTPPTRETMRPPPPAITRSTSDNCVLVPASYVSYSQKTGGTTNSGRGSVDDGSASPSTDAMKLTKMTSAIIPRWILPVLHAELPWSALSSSPPPYHPSCPKVTVLELAARKSLDPFQCYRLRDQVSLSTTYDSSKSVFYTRHCSSKVEKTSLSSALQRSNRWSRPECLVLAQSFLMEYAPVKLPIGGGPGGGEKGRGTPAVSSSGSNLCSGGAEWSIKNCLSLYGCLAEQMEVNPRDVHIVARNPPLSIKGEKTSKLKQLYLRANSEEEALAWVAVINRVSAYRLEDVYELLDDAPAGGCSSSEHTDEADDDDDDDDDDEGDAHTSLDSSSSSAYTNHPSSSSSAAAFGKQTPSEQAGEEEEGGGVGLGGQSALMKQVCSRRRKHGRGRCCSVVKARRRCYSEDDTDDDSGGGGGRVRITEGAGRPCALKVFDKALFWEEVGCGRERMDALIRESAVQALLTLTQRTKNYCSSGTKCSAGGGGHRRGGIGVGVRSKSWSASASSPAGQPSAQAHAEHAYLPPRSSSSASESSSSLSPSSSSAAAAAAAAEEAASFLSSPSLLSRFYGVFETDELFVLEMELFDGATLFDVISTEGALEEAAVASIMDRLLRGIQLCQDTRIAHRDLKPSNLLYYEYEEGSGGGGGGGDRGSGGQPSNSSSCGSGGGGGGGGGTTTLKRAAVALTDFGMAGKESGGLIRGRCGTPGYAAPEILKAGMGEGYANKVDVFSAGTVAYTALCGYEPFEGDTVEEVLDENANCRYQFDIHGWRDISLEAQDFVESLMEKDPNLRLTPAQALQHPWLRHHLDR